MFLNITKIVAVLTFLVSPAFAIGSATVQTPTLTFVSQTQTADVPPPPALAKDSKYVTNTETAVLHGTVPEVRAFFENNPVTDFVAPTDTIPAIENIVYLSGNWPEVGALRRVDLAGGDSIHERVLRNTQGNFAYQIWNITAPAGRAINHIMGEFTFEQDGDMVNVTWDYNIKPSIFVARPAIRNFLKNDFGPFMRSGLSGTVNVYNSR